MSLTPKKRSQSRRERPRSSVEKPRKTHFTTDGKKRYCTGRPKGKDELERDWKRVDCDRCRFKMESFVSEKRRRRATENHRE